MAGGINPNVANQSAWSGNANLNKLDNNKLEEQRANNGGANIQTTENAEGAEGASKTFTVFATDDTNPRDGKIDAKEAQSGFGSIFNNAKSSLNEKMDTAIKNSSRLSDELKAKSDTQSIVQRYLGNNTIANLIGNWSGFTDVTYDTVQVSNNYEATGTQKDAGVQAQIDAKVQEQVQQQVNDLTAQISSKFEAALNNAIAKAENQLVGDKDVFDEQGNIRSDVDLNDLKFTRETDDNAANVSTYNSAQSAEGQSQGYVNTVNVLKNKGAKCEQKLVNGVKQDIYKLDGQYYAVDDAGQLHDLSRDKGFLRSSKFTTEDSIQDAMDQSRSDGIEGNDAPENRTDVKVKVRNVDGQNQSVMTWKDENGKTHSRVIDHNEQSGMTASTDVHQVNVAGTRAKYSSETSGLGAWVKLDDDGDDKGVKQYNDNNHMVQDAVHDNGDGTTTAGHVRTHRGRMKIDKANVGQAIEMMCDAAFKAGATISMKDENTTIIQLNGHEYVLDATDHKAADRTMRMIQSELDQIKGRPTVKPNEGEYHADTSKVEFVDNRTVTADGGKWGVNHDTLESNSTEINTIKYDSSLSRADFAKQGWKASTGRSEESTVLAAMNNYMTPASTENGNPTVTTDVTGMTTHIEFATRFLEVMLDGSSTYADGGIHKGKSINDFNVHKLADAIKTANPSFFDDAGNMYKDCDFNRINLPRKLEAYLAD